MIRQFVRNLWRRLMKKPPVRHSHWLWPTPDPPLPKEIADYLDPNNLCNDHPKDWGYDTNGYPE